MIPAIEKIGARYDASLGWPDRAGFRAGACFAFPLYDFAHERPANFLEIPLVFMDQNLLQRGRPESEWLDAVEEVISTSRRYGWGGVSVLWHNMAFEAMQLPAEAGRVFWTLMDRRAEVNDAWFSATQFERTVRHRYAHVGLLQ